MDPRPLTGGGPAPLPTAVDVLVVGAGLTGAAAAWRLAQRGHEVAVLDRVGPANAFGSSHGSARIVRRAYADPFYVSLTGRAFEGWHELEDAAGCVLLRRTGGLDHGNRREVPAIADALAAAGVPHEVLPAAEAQARWPGMRFDGDVLHHPDAGTVDAERAVEAMLGQLPAHGATVHFPSLVTSVSAGDGVATVVADGSTIRARRVVLAAGAWLGGLADGQVTLPSLTVTQEQVFHFARREPAQPPWPVSVHKYGRTSFERNIYHLPGGRDGGPGDDRKVAEHCAGPPTTAEARDGQVDPAARRRVVDYVRDWLPGLDPVPRTESTCLYTSTPNEDFVLDAVGPIVVASPCSGHGAKFAPLLGSFVADLVEGRPGSPERFALAAHLGVAR